MHFFEAMFNGGFFGGPRGGFYGRGPGGPGGGRGMGGAPFPGASAEVRFNPRTGSFEFVFCEDGAGGDEDDDGDQRGGKGGGKGWQEEARRFGATRAGGVGGGQSKATRVERGSGPRAPLRGAPNGCAALSRGFSGSSWKADL